MCSVNMVKVGFTAINIYPQQMNFKSNEVCKQNTKEHTWEICIFQMGKIPFSSYRRYSCIVYKVNLLKHETCLNIFKHLVYI
jgi:hypothetical protein